jgi:hypothetical protein
MKRKVLASSLAAIMMLSCTAFSAFAADETASNNAPTASDAEATQEIEVTTEVKTPEIKVTLPTSTKLVINPYKIKVKPYDDATEVATGVVGANMVVTNNGETGVTIGATAAISVPKTVTLASTKLSGTETKATVLVYLEGVTLTGSSATPTYSGVYDSSATNQLLLAAKAGTSPKTILTLAAGSSTATYGAIAFQGEASPTSDWSSVDSSEISTTLTFTIDPVAPAASTSK